MYKSAEVGEMGCGGGEGVPDNPAGQGHQSEQGLAPWGRGKLCCTPDCSAFQEIAPEGDAACFTTGRLNTLCLKRLSGWFLI